MPFPRNTVHYTGNDNLYNTGIVKFCVADTRHLHSEPDPTFYFDSDPEINFYYILIQKQMFLFIWIK